jgi:hypothetical protein
VQHRREFGESQSPIGYRSWPQPKGSIPDHTSRDLPPKMVTHVTPADFLELICSLLRKPLASDSIDP